MLLTLVLHMFLYPPILTDVIDGVVSNIGYICSSKRVFSVQLQNALRSFMEVAEQFPPEIQEVAKFGQPLEATDETGRTLAVSEFAQVRIESWS